jgi:hypothetical protein
VVSCVALHCQPMATSYRLPPSSTVAPSSSPSARWIRSLAQSMRTRLVSRRLLPRRPGRIATRATFALSTAAGVQLALPAGDVSSRLSLSKREPAR